MHLRWLGSLPGRVPVNARERFSHESVPTACFHPPPGRRGPAPRHPPGALAPHRPRRHRRGALRHFCRLNVLNLSSNRPRIVLESSSNRPTRIPPGSRHRSYPAHAARRTSGWPLPGLPKPAAADQPLRGLILPHLSASISAGPMKPARRDASGPLAPPTALVAAVAARAQRPRRNEACNDPARWAPASRAERPLRPPPAPLYRVTHRPGRGATSPTAPHRPTRAPLRRRSDAWRHTRFFPPAPRPPRAARRSSSPSGSPPRG